MQFESSWVRLNRVEGGRPILSEEQKERYARQLAMPAMSEHCQQRLINSCAVVLGDSESAAIAAAYLAEVGVGKIELAGDSTGGAPSILERLRSSNGAPDLKLITSPFAFNAHVAEKVLENADVVIDGLGDWQRKLLASDACMHLKKVLVHAGSLGFRVHVYAMRPGRSACLRCVLPAIGIDDVARVTAEDGYFPPLAGLVGALQAIEATKLMAQLGATQGNELFKYDCLSGEIETIRGLDPVADCPDCGNLKR